MGFFDKLAKMVSDSVDKQIDREMKENGTYTPRERELQLGDKGKDRLDYTKKK